MWPFVKLLLVCHGSSWILKTQRQSDLFHPKTPWRRSSDRAYFTSCSRYFLLLTWLFEKPSDWQHINTNTHTYIQYIQCILCYIEEPTFNYCLGFPLLPFNLKGNPRPRRSIYPLCIMLSALPSIYHNWLVSTEEPNQWKDEKSWGRVTSLVIPGEPSNGWQGEWQLSTELTRFRCWTWQH